MRFFVSSLLLFYSKPLELLLLADLTLIDPFLESKDFRLNGNLLMLLEECYVLITKFDGFGGNMVAMGSIDASIFKPLAMA